MKGERRWDDERETGKDRKRKVVERREKESGMMRRRKERTDGF